MRCLAAKITLASLISALPLLPAQAEDDLTEVVASQDLSVRRGVDKAVVEKLIHPKKVSRKEKSELDRFAMVRFDSESFGKDVTAIGLKLKPYIFSDKNNKPMRFLVYAVKDGDPQDETFDEKAYDPEADDTILDRSTPLMLNRDQVFVLGGFVADQDRDVLFTSDQFLAFARADTNGTMTLVLVRETDSGKDSTFAARESETPPTLVMKLKAAKETAEPEAPAEPEVEVEVEPIAP